MAKLAAMATRSANIRMMARLMPRMARAVPYLGCSVIAGDKPR